MQYEEMGKDLEWKKKLLFAGVFIQENLLHSVFDRYNEMSSKQWLLMAVLKAFDEPPDLSALAKAMGCSRQNVKQLAKHLERDGYIKLSKSRKDARSLCVSYTKKGILYSRENEAVGKLVHEAIFKEFSDSETEAYYALSVKLMHGIKHLEEAFKKRAEEEKK